MRTTTIRHASPDRRPCARHPGEHRCKINDNRACRVGASMPIPAALTSARQVLRGALVSGPDGRGVGALPWLIASSTVIAGCARVGIRRDDSLFLEVGLERVFLACCTAAQRN